MLCLGMLGLALLACTSQEREGASGQNVSSGHHRKWRSVGSTQAGDDQSPPTVKFNVADPMLIMLGVCDSPVSCTSYSHSHSQLCPPSHTPPATHPPAHLPPTHTRFPAYRYALCS